MKKTAVAFLAAALAAIALSFLFSQRAVAIQGPSALAVLEDQTVWLSVDEALWHISSDGRRVTAVDSRTLGLKGGVGNIALDPSGMLVLGLRDQGTLHVFDPGQARIARSFSPQWPASLAQHASRAISYAFSAKGQLAIATGGGHAVALFDASGQFLRRSPPGLYRFTNGLWWQGETLWTTNTNGFELIALSAPSMTALQTVSLLGDGYGRYLGMAVASHGNAAGAAADARPLGTVVRFLNGMVTGRIVDVFPDGTEREFQGAVGLEPRDIAWQGDKLLAVDGASFAIKQFGADGNAMPDFGDAEVRAALTSLAKDKARFQLGHRAALYLAIGLFCVGFVLAIRSARQEQRAAQGRVITPETLGIPALGKWDQVRKSMLFLPAWVFFAILLWLALWPFGPPGWLARWLAPLGLWGSVVAVGMAWLLMLLYTRFAFGWAASRPDWEPVVNAWALQSLSRAELARALEPGESVRETLVLAGFPSRWLVLTQRRVLVFSVNRRDRTLRHTIDSSEITHVSLSRWSQLSWSSRLRTLWNGGVARLEMVAQGKTLLSGYVVSMTTAERVVALLLLQSGRTGARKPVRRERLVGAGFGHWRWQVLATALVPGLGQWMQRRSGTALIFFLIFSTLMLASTVPLMWTLQGPRAAVSASSVVTVIVSQLMLALIAAWDCWNMRQR